MSLSETLTQRSSVRAFTSQAIPQQQLNEIFSLAQQAISNCNVQPWQTMVVSGETRDKLKKAFMATLMSGAKPNPDFDWNPRYEGEHRQRQFGSANVLYSAMGIEREDKKARQSALIKNWSFFDAPHAVFFCMEKYLGIMGAVDLGVYAQTLSLIMQEQGISSCMQGALGQFPDPVRQTLNLSENTGVLFGMSFGYKDDNAAANKARTSRVELAQAVNFFD